MTSWLDNHELAEKECRTGWTFEELVAAKLREGGLFVEMPEKVWRADVNERKKFENEVDILANGRRISVKSRRVKFTSPADVPNNRNPLFVDTVRKWEKVSPEPAFVVCVSQETGAAIWLGVAETGKQWTVVTRYDNVRGYSDDFMQADRSLWRPIEELIPTIRNGRDGSWWLSTSRMTVGVTVVDGIVVQPLAPIVRKFVGQPFICLVRWMRNQGDFKSERLDTCSTTTIGPSNVVI